MTTTRLAIPQRRAAIVRHLSRFPATPAGELARVHEVSGRVMSGDLSALVESGDLVRLDAGSYCIPEDVPPQRSFPPLSAVDRRAAMLAWIAADRVCPSLRELSAAFGVNLTSIARDVRTLTDGGALRTLDGRHGRNLEATGAEWTEPNARRTSREVFEHRA